MHICQTKFIFRQLSILGLAITITSLLSASPEMMTLPVGVVEVPIVGEGKTAFISQGGLVAARVFEGPGAVPTATSLTADAPGWVPGAYAGTHYVQLNGGEWSAITANGSDALTLESDLPISPSVVFKIHPLQTVDGLFGANNTAGFTGGADLSSGDLLALWDSSVQNYLGFLYYNSTRERWEDASNNYAGGTILYPDEGLLVIGATDGSIRLKGEVQLDGTVGVLAGEGSMSIVPNPYVAPVAIKDAGFEDALSGGATFGDADWLLVWDNDLQSFSGYFYYDTDDSTWKDAGNNPATEDDVIVPSSSIAVIKNSVGVSTWKMSQPFTFTK
jgi:hypothetical protein